MGNTVLYARDGHVATITYNRPEALNAINGELRQDLNAAWNRFREDEDAWVGIVTGAGRAFCVGADMKDWATTRAALAAAAGMRPGVGVATFSVEPDIALPAGIAKMNQARFHLYTFIGSWPWCYILAYVGMKLGAQWNTNPRFKEIFHRFHLGVEVVLLIGIIWFVISHWKNRIRTTE